MQLSEMHGAERVKTLHESRLTLLNGELVPNATYEFPRGNMINPYLHKMDP